MELLFVALGGAVIGIAAHFTFPNRHAYGVTVLPALATAAASLVWVILTWAGMPWDGGWIWAITLVAAAGITAISALGIGRRRTHADAQQLDEWLKNGVPQA